MDIKLLKSVEALCKQNYNEETLRHVYRVADYVLESPLYCELSEVGRDVAYAVALLHDEDNPDNMVVRQDAEVLVNRIGNMWGGNACATLHKLTRKPKEDYLDYIQRLREGGRNHVYDPIAYIVKLADVKDHLRKKDTLTDKLKEKYWEALPYLL